MAKATFKEGMMSRITAALTSVILALSGMSSVSAQDQEFSGLARIDPEISTITASGSDGVKVALGLSQGVPYRLFTLDNPPRVVIDFQEVDWGNLKSETLLDTDRIDSVQFGAYLPRWSRMVLALKAPMNIDQAELKIDQVTANARLDVTLMPVSADIFAASAGAPSDPRWDLPDPEPLPARPERSSDAPLVVMLDPGHGGIDPGAEHGGIVEKLMILTFARELRDVLVRSGGFIVHLTRDEDIFVSLERRVALAHQAGADVFISLHADALSEGLAHGATVHVLSREASDIASEKLAERHDRADLLAGVDLSGTDDQVTDILLDLARQETRPRTQLLAESLVDSMTQAGKPMNRRPLRKAAFSVLKAADIPSVLIEIGFLSSPRDFENLQDPAWRLKMAESIRNGLNSWRKSDEAQRALVRQ
jgi:N-acetylmuramoyl-L-alanine amidase